jgi:hypothetical protein
MVEGCFQNKNKRLRRDSSLRENKAIILFTMGKVVVISDQELPMKQYFAFLKKI